MPQPGCKTCVGGRTARGGVGAELNLDGSERYEVRGPDGDAFKRSDGQPARFRSAMAAAAFMRGRPGARLVELKEA